MGEPVAEKNIFLSDPLSLLPLSPAAAFSLFVCPREPWRMENFHEIRKSFSSFFFSLSLSLSLCLSVILP
ncbi:hypothetical protein GGR50DRAFT_638303 [Xylaria sp. CBS 124048]|nr:hypothetical protein GGR50DRAFT_638303 [Xylaria sp. CBS 124048]